MGTINYLLFFIAITVLVFLIWNIVLGNKISNKVDKSGELSDSKYWELKFKSQYMISMFAVLMALVAYLGYNSMDQIKKETKDYLIAAEDSVQKLSDSIRSMSKKIEFYNLKVDTFKKSGDIVYDNLKSFQNSTINLNGKVLSIKNLIDSINSNNKLEQKFYVVDSLFQLANAAEGKLYKYAELKTSLGDNLPKFNRPPVIVPLTRSNCDITVEAKNNDFFVAYFTSCSGEVDFDKPIKLYFSVLIIETP